MNLILFFDKLISRCERAYRRVLFNKKVKISGGGESVWKNTSYKS